MAFRRLLKLFLLASGLIFTGLGIAGIFIPLLPTTPFLLLAAACFARSSERFHSWLTEHEKLGPFIKGYLDGSGIPLRAKVVALTLIWLTLPPSTLMLVSNPWLKMLLLILAITLSIYLFNLPTRQEDT